MENQPLTIQQLLQQKADLTRKEICLLLNWSELEYGQFVYETGVAYLAFYLPCDEYGRDQLLRSKLYWNWFKNIWTAHDTELAIAYKFIHTTISQRQQYYKWMHCPHDLAIEYKPNDVVLSSIKKTTAQ